MKREARRALTLGEIEEQIFQREGFRVSFVPLSASDHPLPPYAYPVMAPAGWHVSDWRRVRLAPYIVSFRDVVVYRGDGTRLAADLKLGHLRDTYYAAHYGTLAPETAPALAGGATRARTRGPSERGGPVAARRSAAAP